MNWILFALLTVFSWGVYGVLLHIGRSGMPAGAELPNASLKAFLWVGMVLPLRCGMGRLRTWWVMITGREQGLYGIRG